MSDANRTQMLTSDPNRTVMGSAPTFDPNKTMMGSAPTINATVTIKPIQCPVCKTFNPGGVMFCVDCGLIFDRALDGDAFGAPVVQVPMLVDMNGREYPLRPGTTVIGREADISLMDSKISRRHGQVTNTDGVLVFEDLGSTNGSKVNGNKVALEASDRNDKDLAAACIEPLRTILFDRSELPQMRVLALNQMMRRWLTIEDVLKLKHSYRDEAPGLRSLFADFLTDAF